MWRLIQPLDYLKIKHPEKLVFDWLLPLFCGLLLSSAWFVDGFREVFFRTDGFASQIQSLLTILAGFFIAALAAVATFEGHGMDKPMPGKVSVTLWSRRTLKHEPLSRRRFLCLLFSYLAFLSLALYFALMLIGTFSGVVVYVFDNAAMKIGSYICAIGKWLIWATYCLALCQLFINTLLGLYYLGDRIHRDDGESVIGNPNPTSKGQVTDA